MGPTRVQIDEAAAAAAAVIVDTTPASTPRQLRSELRRVGARSKVVELPLHPADPGGPATTLPLLSSRIQSLVETRGGAPSKVRRLLSGGDDYEASVDYASSVALYDPRESAIRLREQMRVTVEKWLGGAIPDEPQERRATYEQLRTAIVTLTHEHIHALGDGSDPLLRWTHADPGFAFSEGIVETAAQLLTADAVRAAGLDAAHPELLNMPFDPGTPAAAIAAGMIVSGLAVMAGTDPLEAMLTVCAGGAGLSALSALTTSALASSGAAPEFLRGAVIGVLETVDSRMATLLGRTDEAVAGSVADAVAVATAVIDVARGNAALSGGTAAAVDARAAFESVAGAGTIDLLRCCEEPNLVMTLPHSVTVIATDRQLAGISDTEALRRVEQWVKANGAPPPGTRLTWAATAGAAQRELG